MKNKAFAFRLILIVSSLGFSAAAVACVLLFREPGGRLLVPMLATGGSGLVFTLVALLCVGAFARPYRVDFGGLQEARLGGPATAEQDYSAALEDIGGAPLKALIVYLLLAALFVLGLMFFPGAPGTSLPARGAALSFILSFAMLSAAFLYVLTDKLSLTTLLAGDLHSYPAALRDNRQRRKNLIIPMFTTLMTLLFAYSCAFLFGRSAEKEAGAGFTGFLVAVIPISAFYFCFVLALMFTWGANTALLFRSVISELEQLSSADKDLTRRISICSVDEIATISGMMNTFCDGLAESLREIRRSYAQLYRVQESLFAGIRTSSAASGEMAGGIDGLIGMIEREDLAVRRSLESAESLAQHVAAVASSSREQSISLTGSVERVSSRRWGK